MGLIIVIVIDIICIIDFEVSKGEGKAVTVLDF
jgi:hypothetical protein